MSPEIQYGKRKPLKDTNTIIDRIPITMDIHESNTDTWPHDVRFWWSRVKTCDDAQKYSLKLKEYYSQDEEIINIANQLETYSKLNNVVFDFKY